MLECRWCAKLICAFFIMVACPGVVAQKICDDGRLLASVIERHHLNGHIPDTSYHRRVTGNYIELLDPHRFLFRDADLKELRAGLPVISPNGLISGCDFVARHVDLYVASLQRALTFLDSLHATDMPDYTADTLYFSLGSEKITDQDPWLPYLRLQTLLETNSLYELDADSLQGDYSFFRSLMEPAYKMVIEREKCLLNKRLEDPDKLAVELENAFLNSLLLATDPHSAYLPREKHDMMMSDLSRNVLSFGIEPDQDADGSIIVEALLPGGPAWDSGMMNEGDRIIRMTSQGAEHDFTCATLNEVIALLGRDDIREATFTIRKSSQDVKTVVLSKEVVNVLSNSVEGYILSGNKKIGYLAVPSFFQSGSDDDQTGVTHDIAREILYLRDEKIEGLILDLRYNGGGSVQEAVELAGLFINEGPLFISRSGDDDLTLIKDLHRGYVYGGPVIVLLNGYSASASELFAAAIQDHRRGLVMGSQSFGKSTGQVVLPLDKSAAYGYSSPEIYNRSRNFLKITTTQYYRLDGTSIQQNGVTPDLPLPDEPFMLTFREKDFKNAISSGMVKKKIYFDFPDPLPVEALNVRLAQRLAANGYFSWLEENQNLADSIPLHSGEFFDLIYGGQEGFEYSGSADFEVLNHELIEGISGLNENISGRHEERRDEIQNDPYVNEAFLTLNDLIQLKLK